MRRKGKRKIKGATLEDIEVYESTMNSTCDTPGTKIRYRCGDHEWPIVVRPSVPRKYDDVCLMEPSGEFEGKQTETLSTFIVTEVFWIEWPPGEETVGITLERLPKPKEDEA